jgi:lathosterol oxidase
MELPGFVLALLAVITLERTRWRRLPVPFLRPAFAADLLFLATGVVALGMAMRALAARAAATLGVPPLPHGPALASLAATVVAYDFGAWSAHWLMHRVPFLWRVHAVHHASPRLDWLAAFRMHPLELALRHALSPVLLLLCGFAARDVAVASIVAGGWAALAHANLGVRWKVLEGLLVTPRLHHLHHVPETSERNLGAIFSFWDRLAGRLEPGDAPRDAALGVPDRVGAYPDGWWRQICEPFRASHASARSSASRSSNSTRNGPAAGVSRSSNS